MLIKFDNAELSLFLTTASLDRTWRKNWTTTNLIYSRGWISPAEESVCAKKVTFSAKSTLSGNWIASASELSVPVVTFKYKLCSKAFYSVLNFGSTVGLSLFRASFFGGIACRRYCQVASEQPIPLQESHLPQKPRESPFYLLHNV